MNVFVVTDLEGVCGVVHDSDVQLAGERYEMARRMLTAEVNAVVRGAAFAGADEIVVLNGHGSDHAYNVNFDEIEPPAVHVAGSPWDRYLPGLDETTDLVFQLGAHARSGTAQALLEHTMSSASWMWMKLNAEEIGEMQLIGAFAAHYGARMALVTGDAAACAEAEASFPGVLTVQTKTGLARTAGILRPHREVLAEVELVARRAVESGDSFPQRRRHADCALDICFAHTPPADAVAVRTGVERLDGTTVRLTGRDIIEAFSRLY